MKTSTETIDTPARIYVGTYGKYASGSIAGAWIDLDGHDAETLAEVCAKLHSDEADPEFMIQDFEGFPRSLYSESGLPSAEVFEWLELDEGQRELVNALLGAFLANDVSDAIDKLDNLIHYGDKDAVIDSWLEHFEIPEGLEFHIDRDSIWREISIEGTFLEIDGDLYEYTH